MLSSMTSGELRHESRDRHSLGRILKSPPRSAASGRLSRSWKAPPTRSLSRLRYVAHAFQRAGSGGFPAARWWYFQDGPRSPGAARGGASRLVFVDGLDLPQAMPGRFIFIPILVFLLACCGKSPETSPPAPVSTTRPAQGGKTDGAPGTEPAAAADG